MKKGYIDEMRKEDWGRVADIYREGIATGNATFQKDVPSWEEWDANHLQTGRIVVRSEDSILGWAAMSPVSSRSVYRGVATYGKRLREPPPRCFN